MITITLISNAGLLIASANTKVLIDALYRHPPRGFSAPPEGVQTALEQGIAPFDGVEYALFTHAHPDHFDRAAAKRYIERYQPHVVVSSQQAKELGGFAIDRCTILPAEEGVLQELRLGGDDAIQAFAIRHSGKEYAAVANLCYLLKLEGKRILILGDADFDPEYLARMAGVGLDAVIANPLFLTVAKGRQALFEALRPKRTILYHMPFEADDFYGMRKLVSRVLERYAKEENVTVLDEQAGTLSLL